MTGERPMTGEIDMMRQSRSRSPFGAEASASSMESNARWMSFHASDRASQRWILK